MVKTINNKPSFPPSGIHHVAFPSAPGCYADGVAISYDNTEEMVNETYLQIKQDIADLLREELEEMQKDPIARNMSAKKTQTGWNEKKAYYQK